MPIAVLVLALVAYGYALLAFPEFRRPGLIGGALVGHRPRPLLLAAVPRGDPRRGRGSRPRSSPSTSSTSSGPPRGATLTGRVANGSPASACAT